MIVEAMACGTPVIAFPEGAVEELVVPGQAGFICSHVDAIERVSEIDRETCRRYVENRFSNRSMADDYERVYRRLIAEPSRLEHVDQAYAPLNLNGAEPALVLPEIDHEGAETALIQD